MVNRVSKKVGGGGNTGVVRSRDKQHQTRDKTINSRIYIYSRAKAVYIQLKTEKTPEEPLSSAGGRGEGGSNIGARGRNQ